MLVGYLLKHGCVQLGVTFDFSFAKLGICETYYYHKDKWVAVPDYYMYFYLIILFPLIAILQLRNFAAS